MTKNVTSILFVSREASIRLQKLKIMSALPVRLTKLRNLLWDGNLFNKILRSQILLLPQVFSSYFIIYTYFRPTTIAASTDDVTYHGMHRIFNTYLPCSSASLTLTFDDEKSSLVGILKYLLMQFVDLVWLTF